MKLYRSFTTMFLPAWQPQRVLQRITILAFFLLTIQVLKAQSGTPSSPAQPATGIYGLPVDVAVFTLRFEDAGIGLDWSTQSETHINYFVIEKSTDNQHFSDIATVFARGGDKGSSYHYTDEMKGYPAGLVYYRIRIIASGGNIRHSEVRMIRPPQSNNEGQLAAFPNPCDNTLSIVLPSNWQNARVAIQVYSPAGVLVLQQACDRTGSVAHLDLSALGRGMYLVKAYAATGTLYQKIQKN